MKKFSIIILAVIFSTNSFAQLIEPLKSLTHTTKNISATVWNDGFIGDNPVDGKEGIFSWKGQDGIWCAGIVYGTASVGSVNGSYGDDGSHYIDDWRNNGSNFSDGFKEETIGSVTFDQVSKTTLRDNGVPIQKYGSGFTVIQKSYSNSLENFIFFRYGFNNTTGDDIQDLYVGHTTGWEIENQYDNTGGIDLELNLTYACKSDLSGPYFGVVAIDSLYGCKLTQVGPVNLRTETFTYISTIDTNIPTNCNIGTVGGTYIEFIAKDDTSWITFAYVAGDNLTDLKVNAQRAREVAASAGWTDKLASVYTGDQIINVPNDYSTIQEAINASADGDTVLVADGTYFENINFNGKAITLASHFLIDGNKTHIDNTIINGSKPKQPDKGTVVQFDSGEDTTSVLYGFTITGGKGSLDPYGYGTMGAGGIGVNNAGAKIKCNKITGNIITHNSDAEGGGIIINANSKDVLILENFITNNKLITSAANSEGGGGIFLYNCNSHNITIAKNIIADNIVSKTSGALAGYGGAIYLNSSKALIRNNLIKNNRATYGGGISVDEYLSSDSPDLINNTIVKNEASYKGGGLYVNSYGVAPKMINSILWGNKAPTDPQLNSRVFAEFSSIQGDFSGLGNIDMNPLFEDTVDCCLSSSSPCIDAGDPNETYNDLDGSRNDMGCYGGHSPLNMVTDVKEITAIVGIPNTYTLSQNYPNPFNPTTTINYSIPPVDFGFVPTTHLAIYDILGQEIEVLVNKKQNPGTYKVTWDARHQTSGVYFCKLQVGSFVETKKMILLR